MAKYERFEDMPVWQDGKKLTVDIHRLTHQNNWKGFFVLQDQMCRSSLSIPSNVAEGFKRGSTRELRHFLYVARGSAGELRTQMEVAHDLDLLNGALYKDCVESSRSISRQLTAFISSLSKHL